MEHSYSFNDVSRLLDRNFFENLKTHSDREDTLKKAYEEQMRTLKYELENMKSEFQSKTIEFAERSNQHDASSIMLKSLKEKHENELELLKEVCTGGRQLTPQYLNPRQLTPQHLTP